MLFLPAGLRESHVANQPIQFDAHRDREPLNSLWSLNPISIPPVVLRVLEIIAKDKQIDFANDIEIPLPRYVVGLQNGDSQHDETKLSSVVLRIIAS